MMYSKHYISLTWRQTVCGTKPKAPLWGRPFILCRWLDKLSVRHHQFSQSDQQEAGAATSGASWTSISCQGQSRKKKIFFNENKLSGSDTTAATAATLNSWGVAIVVSAYFDLLVALDEKSEVHWGHSDPSSVDNECQNLISQPSNPVTSWCDFSWSWRGWIIPTARLCQRY